MAWAAHAASTERLSQRAQTLVQAADAYWSMKLAAQGQRYQAPTLAFYERHIAGVCNTQSSLSGPFLCPATGQMYLDLAFLQELTRRAVSADNFSLAYVIGHEIGHQVQSLLGTTAAVEQARSRSAPALSARTWTAEELQADCYTGLWLNAGARRARIKLPPDLPAALALLAAVGEEWQKQLAADQVMPDPFTYGTPAQRLRWFRRGLDGGRDGDCDTFSADAAGTL
jgi:predicted metalloprotease